MGLIGPIRGRGSPPPWAMAPREGPLPLLVRHPLPLWNSPTWEVGGGCAPSLAYIRRGRGALLFIIFLRQILFSLFLLSPSSSGLPLLGGYTWLGISPPYARRRAAGIGIRIHLLFAALLVRSSEGRRV